MAVVVDVEGEIWFWRGPAPFHFVTVPEHQCPAIQDAARIVSYGWGMVPVTASTGTTTWTTALTPKDGRYLVPIKDAVRRAEELDVGDTMRIRLTIGD